MRKEEPVLKKSIGLIHMDSSLIRWLYEKLKLSGPDTDARAELLEGLEDLMNGAVSALMLESAGGDAAAFAEDEIRCGALCIFARSRRVLRDNTELSLTPKEFDILYFLARNRGEVFTKEQIYQAVWDSDYLLDDSNIMAFIRKLRKKIEPNPDAPEYILTIWGIGYKFNDQL